METILSLRYAFVTFHSLRKFLLKESEKVAVEEEDIEYPILLQAGLEQPQSEISSTVIAEHSKLIGHKGKLE